MSKYFCPIVTFIFYLNLYPLKKALNGDFIKRVQGMFSHGVDTSVKGILLVLR